jgi:hypothetical protein
MTPSVPAYPRGSLFEGKAILTDSHWIAGFVHLDGCVSTIAVFHENVVVSVMIAPASPAHPVQMKVGESLSRIRVYAA